MLTKRGHFSAGEKRVVIVGVVIAAIVVYDIATGAHALGATARFLWQSAIFFWRGFAFVVTLAARKADVLLIMLMRRRAFRFVAGFAAVGIGYAGSAVLSDAHVEKAQGWRSKTRAVAALMRDGWRKLPTPVKYLVVALLIFAQVGFLPTLHEYLLLFPVGFMVPGILRIVRFVVGAVGDSFIVRLCRRYLGDWHDRMIERFHWIGSVHGFIRLWRMRYLTAWRIWYHDPRYWDAETGKPRLDIIEPFRLWRAGKLDRYIGHPLLSGRKRVV